MKKRAEWGAKDTGDIIFFTSISYILSNRYLEHLILS